MEDDLFFFQMGDEKLRQPEKNSNGGQSRFFKNWRQLKFVFKCKTTSIILSMKVDQHNNQKYMSAI